MIGVSDIRYAPVVGSGHGAPEPMARQASRQCAIARWLWLDARLAKHGGRRRARTEGVKRVLELIRGINSALNGRSPRDATALAEHFGKGAPEPRGRKRSARPVGAVRALPNQRFDRHQLLLFFSEFLSNARSDGSS